MGVSLLHYRPWHGRFRPPGWSVWPVGRVGLNLMFRRKLFWALYALSLLFFFMYFFGQYLLAYADVQNLPEWLVRQSRAGLHLDGTGDEYRNFMRLQGSMVVIVLALAGSLVVGNDFQVGAVPFYLSKPLSPWHYVAGKCLAVAVFVNLMTTLPALVLYVQFGLVTSWDYFVRRADLLAGILGYGLVLSVYLSLLLVALASWLRQTVPLIMAWAAMFLFLRPVAGVLVRVLNYSPRWRLLDLWNDSSVVGNACLGASSPPGQPKVWEAGLVLAVVCLLCLTYLNRRIRAVEIIR